MLHPFCSRVGHSKELHHLQGFKAANPSEAKATRVLAPQLPWSFFLLGTYLEPLRSRPCIFSKGHSLAQSHATFSPHFSSTCVLYPDFYIRSPCIFHESWRIIMDHPSYSKWFFWLFMTVLNSWLSEPFLGEPSPPLAPPGEVRGTAQGGRRGLRLGRRGRHGSHRVPYLQTPGVPGHRERWE